MYGILLIIVVISLSGLIAYAGDQIGMKVGKKRISIFGLRPKYTSILITILTGILIASLTITIILATNNGVRQALFDIQQVYSKLANTRTELNTLNQQMLEKDKEIQYRKEEINDLQKQKEQLAEENSLLEEEKDEIQSKLEIIQTEYKTAQSDIEALQTTKQDLKEQLSELKSQRQELEERIKILNEEVNNLRKDRQNLNDAVRWYYYQDLVYQKGDVIYLDVIKKEDTQEETVDNIIDFFNKANQVVLKQPVKVDEDTGSAIRLKSEDIYGLAATILQSDIDKYVVSLVADVNVSKNMIVPARFQVEPDFVVYEKGALITEKVIDASKSVTEIENELEEILTTINVQSVKRGIITAEQGTVGTINFSRFYEVLNKIQSFKGKVKISVYVTENIWVEDGWNNQFAAKIKFDIEPVGR